jgi:SPP1 family predicted phage head-tail adaptor
MVLPKWKWTQQSPGLANLWSKMNQRVIIQQQKGTVDLAGGTPPDFEDYLTGPDGHGVDAEIREPKPDDIIIALAANIKLTHAIKVRYDNRIKEDMQIKYWDDGEYHYARIKTIVDPNFNHLYMLLGCVEDVPLAEAYR